MGLKFRRGTNAQKSGSLAFGEPYVNTDLGTLQIGGLTGDITLGASGTGSQGSFAGISGSSLDITGNAKIDGNLILGGTITIGDAPTDNVVVNADLSSSIIPNDDNAFDLGSTSKRYRAIHGTNIYGTINATNGVISGSSQLNTLATTGSNTFKGNQTIIGSGAGFAAYISTSVNDATLGLDTTANVNALYFLKNQEKNFEVSYDTTNANGIFRLLPYDNNSFFQIGNPSNSGANYVFISEPTYGNVLIGPGIGNGVSSLVGSTPATDKVQIVGNLYVSGAITANSFTGSIASTNGIVSGSTQVIGILTSLNAFSASENTKSETLRLYTASVDTKFSTLATTTASLLIETANLETFSASALTRFTRIEESTASLNAFSASQNTKSETLRLYTASVDVKFSTLQTYTASVDTTNTTQNNRLNRLEESTASLNSLTSSYARTNTANVFTANQTITGSLFITQDLVVQGSSSIQTISSSRLDIGDNIIQLNVNSPSLRFGGLAIFDSGSAGSSGSLLYDSVEDEFIFVHKGNGTNVTSSHFVLGPETYDNLGNETYLTINRLPKATGKEHIVDSNITDTGTLITLGSNTVVNGTLVASGTSLVSASAQINYTQLSGISANIISASTDSSNVDFIISGGSITANLFGGVVSGSAQVVGILSSLNTYTGSNDTTNTTQNTRLTRIEESTSSLNTLTASLATTYEGRANASKTLFSGSSQVVGSAITTNTITIGSTSTALGGTSTTLAGLTSVSSTAFTGALTGNASTATTLQTARTINGTSFNGSADITIPNLVSGSSQITAGSTTGFATDVKTQLDANTVVSGSSQINVASTTGDIALGTRTSGNYVASLVAGTNITLSNNTGEGATPTIGLTNNAITIAGTSTSLGGTITAEQIRTAIGTVVTGSAQISLGSASGNIALATQTTGDYVASLVAGTGVTLSNNSGENATPTIAIGQSVATNATPTFGNLTINGSINATGDITAYYTSDKRHKNNIQPIENALLKVSKLNGVTWEWNDDVHEVTKSTPKTGLIAQEVQEVLPEVIKEREDGFLALDYSKMMGLMVEAIKEQQSQIHNLTLEIENLKKVKGL